MNKQIIVEKEQINILGVSLTSNLTWEAHTNKLIGNLRHRYRSFSRACKNLTVDTKKLLYNAAIASRLSYCDIIWDKCRINSANKLQTIQNRCARIIHAAQPGVSALPIIRELGWLTLAEKRKLHKCVLLHELLLGRGPQILLDELRPWTDRHSRDTRGTASENLNVIAHSTDYITKSFFYDTSKLWNTLPLQIRRTKNRTTFKEKLHKHFLTATTTLSTDSRNYAFYYECFMFKFSFEGFIIYQQIDSE